LQDTPLRARSMQGAVRLAAAVPPPALHRPGDHPVPRAPVQAPVAAHAARGALCAWRRAAQGLPRAGEVGVG
jgi:hypothetical protein